MPTPHPHVALGRRLVPVASFVREYDVDGQLAQAAIKGLAEYLGLDIVVTDPDPQEKLEDLAVAYLDLLRQLARSPDWEVRAALPRMAYELVTMAMAELREMYARERELRVGTGVVRLAQPTRT